MIPLSLKNMTRIWGYAKRKKRKRCIPKEGMPHASACQKKIYIASYPKRNKKRDGAYKGVHTPSNKNIHTLALLDQGL